MELNLQVGKKYQQACGVNIEIIHYSARREFFIGIDEHLKGYVYSEKGLFVSGGQTFPEHDPYNLVREHRDPIQLWSVLDVDQGLLVHHATGPCIYHTLEEAQTKSREIGAGFIPIRFLECEFDR